MIRRNKCIPLCFLIGLSLAALTAQADELSSLQNQWAEVMYESPAEEREAALESLADQARRVSESNSQDPNLLIWNGIIVSTLAGEKGGLGALGLAKEAKASLESAMKIDPKAMQGSAYTSLGTLYHKVPGWPIGFGSEKKARSMLQKALEINPDGIDPNYFMASFYYDEGEYDKAVKHLEHALGATDRPNRPLADSGRRQEVMELLRQVQAKLK